MLIKNTSFKDLFFELWYKLGKPPWVIDKAQPSLISAVSDGAIFGKTVLDVGCGTGDNAVYLASRSLSVTGVDLSPKAISIAKQKARKAAIDATFITWDAFNLGTLAKKFDTVLDFGLFHNIGDKNRERYIRSLHDVCANKGKLLLLCFSDKGDKVQSGRIGPRLISQDEIRASFAEGWQIEWIRSTSYKMTRSKQASAWLASIICTK
ncbi:MAG: class I SAM-dependent methyltransferase [Pseudomonadales bacterium]